MLIHVSFLGFKRIYFSNMKQAHVNEIMFCHFFDIFFNLLKKTRIGSAGLETGGKPVLLELDHAC